AGSCCDVDAVKMHPSLLHNNRWYSKFTIVVSGIMDRFRELETFLAVAEEGAFNSAARRLRLSPPAVTRLVTGLEERLGVQLFTRTTRRVALTEAGARLREDAQRILAEVEEAETAAAGARAA